MYIHSRKCLSKCPYAEYLQFFLSFNVLTQDWGNPSVLAMEVHVPHSCTPVINIKQHEKLSYIAGSLYGKF